MQTFHQSQAHAETFGNTAQHPVEPGIPQNEGVMSSAIIRFIGGNNQGTEAKFHDWVYTIGSDDDCDIVIKNDGVAPVHILALNEDNTVTIFEKDGMADVVDYQGQDGVPEENLGAVISIGSAQFQIILNGNPVTPHIVPGLHHQGESEKLQNAKEIQDDFTQGVPDGDVLQEGEPIPDARNSSKSYIVALLSILFIAAASYVMYTFLPEHELERAIDPQEQILSTFDRLNAPKPLVKHLHQGAFEVIGYVRTVADKKNIAVDLEKIPQLNDYRIFCQEEIEGMSRQVISQMDWLLGVESIGSGNIRLTGFVTQGQDIDVIAEQLSQDVAGIKGIEKKIWSLNDVMQKIDQLLQAEKINTKIELKPAQGNLSAIGTIDTVEKLRWEKVKDSIQAHFGKEFIIKENIQVVENTSGKISLPITAVTMGKIPSVTFKGGRKYFVGSSLKNGNIIKKISEEKIVMSINGKEYVYPIGKLDDLQSTENNPPSKFDRNERETTQSTVKTNDTDSQPVSGGNSPKIGGETTKTSPITKSQHGWDEKDERNTSDAMRTEKDQPAISKSAPNIKRKPGQSAISNNSEKRVNAFHKSPNKKLIGKSKNRALKTANLNTAPIKKNGSDGIPKSKDDDKDHVKEKNGLFKKALMDPVKKRFSILLQEGIDPLIATQIFNAAKYYDLNPYVIAAVIKVESGFNTKALSSRGASGLMQIMPVNFKYLGIDDAFDPGENIMAGTRYLKEQLTEFKGNIALALAAYNAGPGAVYKYKGVPPYAETRDYIRSVLKQYHHYRITDGSS